MSDLSDRIKRHEGKRNKMYLDSEGIPTVGYGRNLRDVAFSDRELDVMFESDLSRARIGAQSLRVYQSLNETRRGVLIEMVFQMGKKGVSKFKKFLTAAMLGRWLEAHDEMLDSKWAKQTPTRAKRLARIFQDG